jgi:hypothetical protein
MTSAFRLEEKIQKQFKFQEFQKLTLMEQTKVHKDLGIAVLMKLASLRGL